MKTLKFLFAALSLAVASISGPIAHAQQQVTVPAGTRILVRMQDSIDSKNSKAGTRFTATLETNLTAVNTIVARAGTTVYGRLTEAKSAGRMKGGANLTLELTDIVLNGTAYPLVTGTYEIESKGNGKGTTTKVLGGAGLGALIGGIAGGGKGAGIGALAGGALGTGVSAAKKGEQLEIPSESLLEFRLLQPAQLPFGR
jgi:hypothetical protein